MEGGDDERKRCRNKDGGEKFEICEGSQVFVGEQTGKSRTKAQLDGDVRASASRHRLVSKFGIEERRRERVRKDWGF
jgi:hypothetical protein